jgi:hypothetical protein
MPPAPNWERDSVRIDVDLATEERDDTYWPG